MSKNKDDWTEKDERQYKELLKHVPRPKASPDFKMRLHEEIARRENRAQEKIPGRKPLFQRRWFQVALPLAAATALAIALIAQNADKVGAPDRRDPRNLMARQYNKGKAGRPDLKRKAPGNRMARKKGVPRALHPVPGQPVPPADSPENRAARKKYDPNSPRSRYLKRALAPILRPLTLDTDGGTRDGGFRPLAPGPAKR